MGDLKKLAVVEETLKSWECSTEGEGLSTMHRSPGLKPSPAEEGEKMQERRE